MRSSLIDITNISISPTKPFGAALSLLRLRYQRAEPMKITSIRAAAIQICSTFLVMEKSHGRTVVPSGKSS